MTASIRMPALLRAVALLLGAGASVTAAGQALEEVVVNAYRAAEEGASATKTDTPLIETPQSVSVVTREELDARGVTNLNEAVRYNAGVLAEATGIDNRVDDVYIRGFDAGSWSNNVTLDGMRAPQGGQWNRTMFDNWNLERVEVLKGPSAVLYGQVAPGGMVNQISKLPTATPVQQLRVTADEHGTYGAAFDVGGDAGERMLWRLVGLYSDGDTQIEHTSRSHWFVAPSTTLQLGEATKLTLLGLYQRDEGGSTFQFLPAQATLFPTSYGYIDNTTFIGEPSWNVYDRDIYTAGWSFEHAIGERWTLAQGARFTHVDSLFRTTVGGTATLTNERLLGRRAVQGAGDSDGYTADTRLTGRLSLGGAEHTVLAGVDWQKADWDHLRQAAQVAPAAIAIDVFDPVYTHYDFAAVLAPQVSSVGTNRQTGVYLQDQIAVGQWRLTLSGRQDWFEDELLNRLSGVTTVEDNDAFTGRAGVLYLFDSGFAPYVSYAESFQPVGGSTDRNGDPFDPTTGTQWEAGVKYQPAGARGMLTVSAYELRQQNLLMTDPVDPDFSVQTGEARVRGVELEGRITPVAGFSVIGALTWMDSEYTEADDGLQGNDLPSVADFMGSAWLDYSFGGGPLEGLGVAGGLRYVGETWGNDANTFRVPSYTLADAALRYTFGARSGARNATLTLNASNLADKRYVATCTAATACFYGTGRTVVASLRFGW
ncbi:MAG: TonB-dependent siderophore receptor [Steroidobacteraceae bacterium]|nr:TonB-dependent siderophore receptor [Steroidobacteraceae bacterium]MCW5572975.1 TonB-dependent siderophore receptor [Steroidobacteraceae bacterium]